MGVVTTVFFVVIVAAAVVVVVVVVVVVLDAYWPHRPGPKYTNPAKKNRSQLKVWCQDISQTYLHTKCGIINELRKYNA
jgi:hypothetical protein